MTEDLVGMSSEPRPNLPVAHNPFDYSHSQSVSSSSQIQPVIPQAGKIEPLLESPQSNLSFPTSSEATGLSLNLAASGMPQHSQTSSAIAPSAGMSSFWPPYGSSAANYDSKVNYNYESD